MATRDLPVSERIVEVVAMRSDVDPLELPRLYDVVDPDALDTLLAESSVGEVRFRYAGYLVSVDSSGVVRLGDGVTVGPDSEGVAGEAVD